MNTTQKINEQVVHLSHEYDRLTTFKRICLQRRDRITELTERRSFLKWNDKKRIKTLNEYKQLIHTLDALDVELGMISDKLESLHKSQQA